MPPECRICADPGHDQPDWLSFPNCSNLTILPFEKVIKKPKLVNPVEQPTGP